MERVPTYGRDAVRCDECNAVRYMSRRGDRVANQQRIAFEDCCWHCECSVDHPPLKATIPASTNYVYDSWI